jgi:cell division protein ZapA (FtsZ GTPase activity inhibitor)
MSDIKPSEIDVYIFNQRLNLITQNVEDTLKYSQELDEKLRSLKKQYPQAEDAAVLILETLNLFIQIKKITEENEILKKEREEINKALQGFYA